MDRLDNNGENTTSEAQNQAAVPTADQIKEENGRKMVEKRAENEGKDKKEEGLLLAIHGAKIKFNTHLGTLKVLSDVPTTQDKRTGTIVEKKIPNFTFYDGFKMIALTEWQDFGTAKVQENYVLLKKSTLPGTGKLPGNIPPETGKIEFVTSGQVNAPESVDAKGAPVPEQKEDNTEYIYYTNEGYCLGGLENSSKVFLASQEAYNKAKQNKRWSQVNNKNNLLKEKSRIISNNEFSNNAYLVWHEASLTGNKNTALWITHTVNNALNSKYKRGKKTFNELIKTGYSSVGSSDKLKIIKINTNSENEIYARASVIDILLNHQDPTGKAYFWDGLDLFTRKGELDHPKFKQYKSVLIFESHLKEGIAFWDNDNNKKKVNPKATINIAFKTYYSLKKVTNGTIINETRFFVGARTDSQNNPSVTEDLRSTGFHGGTMFWTTK